MTGAGRTKADPSLKKLREKAKMQRYRKRQADMYAQLQLEAFHLETQMIHHMHAAQRSRRASASSSSSMLPWKEVLAAIHEDMEVLSRTNEALKVKSQAVDNLVKSMQQWVHKAQYFAKPPTPSSLHTASTLCRTPWRHVTLDSVPATRKLGFDWITKNLCHNHERVFQQCHFPSIQSSDHVADFAIDTTDGVDRLQFIWRIQNEVAAPLSTVRDAFARPHLLSQVLGKHLNNPRPVNPDISAVIRADDQLLADFGGHACYFHSQWGPNAWVHFLTREFNLTDDRCVFVAQCIQDDPLMPASPHTRHRMIWFVLDKLTDSSTKIRMLCVNSRCLDVNGGPISLDDEVRRWGVDMTAMPHGDAPAEDDLTPREAWILQRITQMALKNVASFQHDLCAVLATESPRRPTRDLR